MIVGSYTFDVNFGSVVDVVVDGGTIVVIDRSSFVVVEEWIVVELGVSHIQIHISDAMNAANMTIPLMNLSDSLILAASLYEQSWRQWRR